MKGVKTKVVVGFIRGGNPEHQYRKRAVVVEAFRMTNERRQDKSEWPDWLHTAWQLSSDEVGSVYPENYVSDGKDPLMVQTLEGPIRIPFGSWIIRGVAGELYPCRDDIFRATYEPEATCQK